MSEDHFPLFTPVLSLRQNVFFEKGPWCMTIKLKIYEVQRRFPLKQLHVSSYSGRDKIQVVTEMRKIYVIVVLYMCGVVHMLLYSHLQVHSSFLTFCSL